MSAHLVLHTLRVGGASSPERLAETTGLPLEDVTAALTDLQAHDLGSHDEGPFGGWSITEEGRGQHRTWIDAELEGRPSARAELESSYRQFLGLNKPVLDICGEWQMRRIGDSVVINDHADAEYDASVLNRLVKVDRSVRQVIDDLTAALSRFGRYNERLSSAMERALAGDKAAVTESLDSYHAVWFQLHEDLLVSLDLSRHDERFG